MAESADTRRYQQNRQAEIDSAALYRALAAAEPQPALAEVYRRLATTEQAHADFWTDALRSAGQPAPPARPGWRPMALGWLARRLGAQFVLPTVVAMERVDSHGYAGQPETRATALPGEERSHARLLRTIAGPAGGGMAGAALGEMEGRHRSAGGNALRAAVLGANDGLVSNLSLVMGVAGAAMGSQAILITGLAGLLAGAGSMALGEWLSVQSSRELYQRQIRIEADELRAVPDEEVEELALIYQAKGLPEDRAREVAARLMADQSSALDTLAREELGIDPTALGGSAWEAAATSFVLFAIGAIIPVLPYFVVTGVTATVISLVVSALGLFVIGAGITLLTGRGIWFSGMRQVLFGLVAAALTFGVGRLIGVALVG